MPIDDGQWLILAATNYMLNPIHEWLKSQGLLFERSGVPSVNVQMIKAIMTWEQLRRGENAQGVDIKNLYKYLGGEFVKRGSRTFKDGVESEFYTLKELQRDHGLTTDAIWHEALTRIPEDKRDYLEIGRAHV